MWRVPFAITLLATMVLIVGSVIAGSSGRALREGEHAPSAAEMKQHLVWGLVYSNPDDPRGWVPKIRGVGWTMNARTRGMAVVLAATTLVLILGTLATVASFVLTVVATGNK